MCDINGCGDQADMPEILIDPEQRRLFLKGLTCLPLAAVLAHSDLAKAAADTTQTVTLKLPDGKEVSAALALPENDNAPTILLIHEWWGLNDQIKSVAAELAQQGYIALAVDLYGGGIATSGEEAMSLMKAVQPEAATQTLSGWIEFLRSHEKGNAKVATMGWCFGGGWSLNASVASAVDATVIYYGRVTTPADQLKNLSGPVLGHFGTLDKNINQEMVAGFESQMKEAGKAEQLTVHWYEANHAFANPTGSRFDADDAATAWERTMSFLQTNIG